MFMGKKINLEKPAVTLSILVDNGSSASAGFFIPSANPSKVAVSMLFIVSGRHFSVVRALLSLPREAASLSMFVDALPAQACI